MRKFILVVICPAILLFAVGIFRHWKLSKNDSVVTQEVSPETFLQHGTNYLNEALALLTTTNSNPYALQQANVLFNQAISRLKEASEEKYIPYATVLLAQLYGYGQKPFLDVDPTLSRRYLGIALYAQDLTKELEFSARLVGMKLALREQDFHEAMMYAKPALKLSESLPDGATKNEFLDAYNKLMNQKQKHEELVMKQAAEEARIKAENERRQAVADRARLGPVPELFGYKLGVSHPEFQDIHNAFGSTPQYSETRRMPRAFRDFDTLNLWGRKCLYKIEAIRNVASDISVDSVNEELGVITKLFERKFNLSFEKREASAFFDKYVYDKYPVELKISASRENEFFIGESQRIEMSICLENKEIQAEDERLEAHTNNKLQTTVDSGIDAL